ncbi:CAP domain-containing protein [Mucilaginibacter ginsenosidivorax]|uniref:CAP domain-containing protein n=1 Tax=Mucilaginibacter ginsenosidivorax TaxID=862126 RepID=A0A5B8W108_9SPHI|nr:CAP domain-containing protein [Mucilaginibacter ginsenosidivorax]QEC77497.1 CAP domain-containing protein [Mucilaginibacter ginsenosidivorax]
MAKRFFYSWQFLFGCLLFTCVAACKKENAIIVGRVELAMLDSVNKLRATGCTCGTVFMPPAKKLMWNYNLAIAAQVHALDMNNNNYFDHISPTGTSPIQRAIAAGYTGQYIGENIAKGYTTIGQVMQAWKKSDDHCKAMMDTLYVEMGAYSYNGYWVQEFGR